jgi:NADPH:quinone reductase-like Zn-dependent oxidoreductase
MRAILIERQAPKGPVSPNIRCVEDWPEPGAPGRGEVLLRSEFTALNRMDLWVGMGIPGVELAYPHISGCDAVARVDGVGEGVDAAWRGRRVVVNAAVEQAPRLSPDEPPPSASAPDYQLIGEHTHGTHRELFLAPVTQIADIGEVDGPKAAAFGLTALTAYGMMVGKGRLRPGQSVLITGIGGGVATAALGLARHHGCRIAVSSRHRAKLEKAVALGAECTILDAGQDWSGEIREWTHKRGVDMVVDTVGQAIHLPCVKSLARGGAFVTAGATSGSRATTDLARLFWNQLRILGSTMGSRAEFLEVVSLLRCGAVEPVIDSVRSWEQAKDAWERFEAAEQMGKLVLSWEDGL